MACGQCGHACSISQRCSALLPCSGLCYCASSCHRPQAAPLRCKAQPRVCAAWSYFLGWAVGPLSSVRKKRQQVLAGHLRGTTITRGPTTGELAQPPAEAQRGCTAHRRPASWQWAERRTGRTKSQAQSLTEAEAKPGLEVRHVVETQICPDGTYSGNPPPSPSIPVTASQPNPQESFLQAAQHAPAGSSESAAAVTSFPGMCFKLHAAMMWATAAAWAFPRSAVTSTS